MKTLISILISSGILLTLGCESDGRPPRDILKTDTDEDTIDTTIPIVTIVGNPESLTIAEVLPASTKIKLLLSDKEYKQDFKEVRVTFVRAGEDEMNGIVLARLEQTITQGTTVELTLKTMEKDREIRYGEGTLLCQAFTVDDREGRAEVPVVIDNEPPGIEIGEETPGNGTLFFSDLKLHFVFSDQVGVKWAFINVYVGSSETPAHTFSFGCQTDCTEAALKTDSLKWGTPSVVYTSAWKTMTQVKVVVGAMDALGNTSEEVSISMTYVPYPHFMTGEHATITNVGKSLASIRLSDGPAVLVASTSGVRAYRRVSENQVEQVVEITNSSSEQIKVVDMDGDGDDDVVVLESDNTLTIYMQESGGFNVCSNGCVIRPGQTINEFALGDLNADDRLDVALALNTEVQSLGIVLSKVANNITSWGEMKTYGGVSKPTLIAIGRFTVASAIEDPRTYILLAKRGTNVVTRFPVDPISGVPSGGQNNSLSSKSSEWTGMNSMIATSIVHDKNGFGDSALVTETSSKALLVLGQTTAGLAVRKSLETGVEPSRVVVGDIDRDGFLDAVVLSKGSKMVQVFWGKKFIDLDGDTKPDADSVLYEGPAMLTYPDPLDVTLTDVDGDDLLDIVVLDDSGKGLSIMAYRPKVGKGVFEGRRMLRIPEDFSPVAIAGGRFATDPSKSKAKDLAVLGFTKVETSERGAIALYRADSEWMLPLAPVSTMAMVPLSSPVGLIVSNLDDNKVYDDLLITSKDIGPATSSTPKPTLAVVRYAGGGNFVMPSGFFAGDSPEIVAVADLDNGVLGDKAPFYSKPDAMDIAVIATFPTSVDPTKTEFRLQTFIGNGLGTFKSQSPGPLVSQDDNPVTLTAAFVQGSAYRDLVVGFGQVPEFTVCYAKSPGLFYPPELRIGLGGTKLIDLKSAYMDGPNDKMTDIVALLDAGLAIVWSSGEPDPKTEKKGSNITWSTSTVPFKLETSGASALGIADMNNDGYQDIVVLFASQDIVAIYPNLGAHRFAEPIVMPTGRNPMKMVITDFNGDGCLDVATMDTVGRSVTFLRSSLCGGS